MKMKPILKKILTKLKIKYEEDKFIVKKTLILLTMISSVATFSKTNGFVEAYNENEANFKKNTDKIKN